MSLFACVECGVVENTALCGWVRAEGGLRRKLVCSQCNPEIGQWHGLFARQDAVEAGYEPIPESPYIRRRDVPGV